MRVTQSLLGLALCATATAASAGPPYLTDDPVPTDTGHWEVYAFTAAEAHRASVDGDSGLDLNYGAIPDVQLTATLPLSFSHARGEGWTSGTGDVELGIKYRFFHDESHGLSASIFPRMILPTAAHGSGEYAQVLLPLWIGKDFRGGTSLFGGGGYLINPGPGNRSYWLGAVALTHELNSQVSVGAEITRQGAETEGATSQTRAGLGSIVHLAGPVSLLVSGGPSWAEHRTGYHLYAAAGLIF